MRIIRLLLTLAALGAATLSQARVHTLENGKIRVGISDEGRLMELRNVVTGTDYAGGGGLWRLYFDTPDQQEIQVEGVRQQPQVSSGEDCITLFYKGVKADARWEGTLRFDLTLTVSLEQDKLRFSATLENNEPHTIIREFQYPLVGDLALPEGFQLLTTKGGGSLIFNVKGEIVREGIKNPYMTPAQYYRQMDLEYPKGAVAANCFALLSEKEGLYFGSHDDRFVNTGHGLRVYPTAEGVFNRLECGFYKYPNCAPGENWHCEANVIAPYSGDWTETSRLYRRWVDESWWDRQTPPEWVRRMKSWQRVIFKHQYGESFFRYDDLPGRIADVEKSVGSDAVLVFGWWKDGMDHGNPDYVPDEAQGGVQGLKDAIARYQEKGGHAALYFNGKLIDRESAFYRSGRAGGMTVRDKSGSESVETYKFTAFGSFLGQYNFRSFVVADSRNEAWRKMMLSWIDLTHEYGAESVFLDQMGSVDRSIANWDISGEFPVPDMAPLAARAEAMKTCRNYVHGQYPGMGIGSEHITDLLSMYVDYSHGDGLIDMIDWFRYTFPELILSDRRIRDDTDIERRVNLTVLKGLRNDIEIFRCRGLIDQTPHYQAYLAKVNALKDRYADLLLEGRFCYKDHFTCSNAAVEARCFTGGERMALVATSEQAKRQNAKLSVPGYRYVESSVIGDASVSADGLRLKLGRHGLAVLIFEKSLPSSR